MRTNPLRLGLGKIPAEAAWHFLAFFAHFLGTTVIIVSCLNRSEYNCFQLVDLIRFSFSVARFFARTRERLLYLAQQEICIYCREHVEHRNICYTYTYRTWLTSEVSPA